MKTLLILALLAVSCGGAHNSDYGSPQDVDSAGSSSSGSSGSSSGSSSSSGGLTAADGGVWR
jgi:hypothetical protein